MGRPLSIDEKVEYRDPLKGEWRALLDQGHHPLTAAFVLNVTEDRWRGWCGADDDLAALAQKQADWWYEFMRAYRRRDRDAAWRTAVFERDGYRCRRCGHGSDLQAHHVKPWAEYLELRFDVDNGETLCIECHAAEHPREAHLIRAAGNRRRG